MNFKNILIFLLVSTFIQSCSKSAQPEHLKQPVDIGVLDPLTLKIDKAWNNNGDPVNDWKCLSFTFKSSGSSGNKKLKIKFNKKGCSSKVKDFDVEEKKPDFFGYESKYLKLHFPFQGKIDGTSGYYYLAIFINESTNKFCFKLSHGNMETCDPDNYGTPRAGIHEATSGGGRVL